MSVFYVAFGELHWNGFRGHRRNYYSVTLYKSPMELVIFSKVNRILFTKNATKSEGFLKVTNSMWGENDSTFHRNI
jgi:hypothetical protein